MSVAFQITAEADDFDMALANLKHIVEHIELMSPVFQDKLPRDGTACPVKIGDYQIGSVSIEQDGLMNGRMRLRRIGEPHPAFERERQQYDFEKNAERTEPRAEVTESWDTGRGE